MERVITDLPESHFDYRYWLRGESTNNDVALHLTIDGQGEAITPGNVGEVYVPFDSYVLGWALLSQTAASASVDVWAAPIADYPPSDADSITASLPLTISGATSSESFDVGTWERFIPAGTVVRFVLDSATDLFYLTVVLILNRPGVLALDLPGLETKADLVHDHDDRYYTEQEVDDALQLISGTHDHDDRYYTEAEVDDLIVSHNHDNIYYIKPEVDTMLSGKAATVHTHDAAAISTGTLNVARIPSLDAAKITSGTFGETRIPVLTTAKIPNLDAAKITTGSFATAQIPSMDAAKITTGTFNSARIPNLAATKITSGLLDDARVPVLTTAHIPNLPASKITSGTIAEARLPSSKNSATFYDHIGTLTSYSSASGTYHTPFSTSLTGLRANQNYVVDGLAMVDGYGDLGGPGSFQMWVMLGGGENNSVTLQMDQGVDSQRIFRYVRIITADGSGNIAIRFRHRQMGGVYTLNFQQFSVSAIAENAIN